MSHKKLITGSFASSTDVRPVKVTEQQRADRRAWLMELGAQVPGRTVLDLEIRADLADLESLFVGR